MHKCELRSVLEMSFSKLRKASDDNNLCYTGGEERTLTCSSIVMQESLTCQLFCA
jgi:hypothetical protein